jgi:hypothetical protein
MMEQNRVKKLIMSNKPVQNGTDVAKLHTDSAAWTWRRTVARLYDHGKDDELELIDFSKCK